MTVVHLARLTGNSSVLITHINVVDSPAQQWHESSFKDPDHVDTYRIGTIQLSWTRLEVIRMLAPIPWKLSTLVSNTHKQEGGIQPTSSITRTERSIFRWRMYSRTHSCRLRVKARYCHVKYKWLIREQNRLAFLLSQSIFIRRKQVCIASVYWRRKESALLGSGSGYWAWTGSFGHLLIVFIEWMCTIKKR